MQEWLILVAGMLATGCVAGVLAGLFGIGGGIVIVPVLETMLGALGVDAAVRMQIAVATSLATIVPTSISSARAHQKRGAVDLAIVKRWAVYLLVGSLVGAWIASQVHSRVLALVFASFALLLAVRMLLFRKTPTVTEDVPRSPLVGIIPAAIGCVSAMM
ncbi:MAG: sulfite exporter TauE/SafE family protein, partial [Pseudomonadota bacterium]